MIATGLPETWAETRTETRETVAETETAAEAETEAGTATEAERQTWIPYPGPLAHIVGHSRDPSTSDHERNALPQTE
jgi:hypothetical protein